MVQPNKLGSSQEEDEDGNRIEPDRQGERIPAWCANYATVATSQADIVPWREGDTAEGEDSWAVFSGNRNNFTGMTHVKHQQAIKKSYLFEKHGTCKKHISFIGHVLIK